MEERSYSDVTDSVHRSVKIILNHDKSSSLLVVSKILVSIGNFTKIICGIKQRLKNLCLIPPHQELKKIFEDPNRTSLKREQWFENRYRHTCYFSINIDNWTY